MPLSRSQLEPWRTWFAARGLDWPGPIDGSQLNDIGLMCDGTAAGMIDRWECAAFAEWLKKTVA